jgi:hypothetical protein
VFSVLLQTCITKMSHIRSLTIRGQHQHQNYEDLITAQNLFFNIISICLDSLFNYAPNLADHNYLSYLDEYQLLVHVNFTAPSSFDLNAHLSFGSLLWMIDFCLKILQKVFYYFCYQIFPE